MVCVTPFPISPWERCPTGRIGAEGLFYPLYKCVGHSLSYLCCYNSGMKNKQPGGHMFTGKEEFSEEYVEEVKRLTRVIEEDFQPHMFIAAFLGAKLYYYNYIILYFVIPVILLALYDLKKKGGLKIDRELIIYFIIKIVLLVVFYGLCYVSIRINHCFFIMQFLLFLPFYMYSYYDSCCSGKTTSSYY